MSRETYSGAARLDSGRDGRPSRPDPTSDRPKRQLERQGSNPRCSLGSERGQLRWMKPRLEGSPLEDIRNGRDDKVWESSCS